MEFSEFAHRLDGCIRGDKTIEDFTYELFLNIVVEDCKFLSDYRATSLKNFYNGKMSITKLSKRIMKYTDPVLFSVYYIKELTDSSLDAICANFKDVFPDIDQNSAPELLADLFIEIIRNAANNEKKCTHTGAKTAKPIDNALQKVIGAAREPLLNDSPFHYKYPKLPNIYGRDDEIRQLRQFLDCETKHTYWVISGNAGMGKSKLVYTLSKNEEIADKWKFVFLNLRLISELKNITDWDYPEDVCFVVDYANSCADDMHIIFSNLFERECNANNRIRFLLIAREGTSSILYENDDYPFWFKDIIGSSSEILNYMYKMPDWTSNWNKPFLELKGISIDDAEIFVKYIVKSQFFVNEDEKSTALSSRYESALKEINTFIAEKLAVNNHVNPLHVLFVTDSYCNTGSLNSWSIPDMNEGMYKKNLTSWKNSIRDNSILIPLCNMLTYSSITGRWKPGSDLPKHLTQYADALYLKRECMPDSDPFPKWFRTLTGFNEEADECVLYSLQPDIFGEYYVLRQLMMTSGSPKWDEWIEFFADRISDCSDFLIRLLQNFLEVEGTNQTVIRIMEDLTASVCMRDDIARHKELLKIFRYNLNYINGRYYKDEIEENSINRLFELFCNYTRDYQDKYQFFAETYVVYYLKRERQNLNTNKDAVGFNDIVHKELPGLYEKWPDSAVISIEYIKINNYFFSDPKTFYSAKDFSILSNKLQEYERLRDRYFNQIADIDSDVAIELIDLSSNVLLTLTRLEYEEFNNRTIEFIRNLCKKNGLNSFYNVKIKKLLLQLIEDNKMDKVHMYVNYLVEDIRGLYDGADDEIKMHAFDIFRNLIITFCVYKYYDEAAMLAKEFNRILKIEDARKDKSWRLELRINTNIDKIRGSGFVTKEIFNLTLGIE